MSTRSVIAAKLSNGSNKAIYCHYDGADNLPILIKHYGTQAKVDALISSGDQRSLGDPCEIKEHSKPAAELSGLEEAFKLDWGQEHIYLWDGSNWSQHKPKAKRRVLKENPYNIPALAKEYFEFASMLQDQRGDDSSYGDLEEEDKYEWACEWLCQKKDMGDWDSSAGKYSGDVEKVADQMVSWLERNLVVAS